jgi:pyruvate dehydrogenase E2 component (dihydrolipoamide acetyltransferase)
MPALGAGMDVGRIVAWRVQPGDEVHRGDIVALVETDKANIDVEVFEDGVVEELLVAEGTKVPVGAPLARIGGASAAVPAEEPEPAVPEAASVAHPNGEVDEHPFVTSPLVRHQAEAAGVDLTRIHGTGPAGLITRHDVEVAAGAVDLAPAAQELAPAAQELAAVAVDLAPVGQELAAAAVDLAPAGQELAAAGGSEAGGGGSSPYARRLAAERELDLASITGSGPRGAVLARDVLAVPAADRAVPSTDGTADADGQQSAAKAARKRAQEERSLAMRQAIARAMERSNREIPHYHLGETVDVERTLTWLTERNADRPPSERVLPAALVLKATALALRDYGDLNGYWIDDAFQPGDGIHLGVAINLRRGGLLAPAIRDADQLTLDELMAALRDLVARTRSAGLRGSELTDPTITVSNLGDTGVELIHGVITPPQVALVGVGRITERPWAVDGMLAVRRTLFLSLAGDHRASDGHRGGRFLAAIAAHLTRPEEL